MQGGGGDDSSPQLPLHHMTGGGTFYAMCGRWRIVHAGGGYGESTIRRLGVLLAAYYLTQWE